MTFLENFVEPVSECGDYSQFPYNDESEQREIDYSGDATEMAMRTYSVSTRTGRDNDKDDWGS